MNRRAFLLGTAAVASVAALPTNAIAATYSVEMPLYGMSPAMVAVPDLQTILAMKRRLEQELGAFGSAMIPGRYAG